MISEWALGLPSLLSEEFPVGWQREKSWGDEFGSPGKLTRLEFSDREQERRELHGELRTAEIPFQTFSR